MTKVLIASLTILLTMTTAAMAGLPRVLVINSYHPSFPWVAAHNDALQWELRNTASLSFFNLDTKRIPPAQYKAAADRAMQRIKIVDPKVVVLADDNALMLLGKRVMKRNIPVVFLGINSNPRKYMIEGGQITGVLERPLLKRSIVFIHDILQNKLKKCLVLFDNGTTSHVVLEDVFHGKQTLAFGGVLTNIRLIGSLHEWQQQVLSAKKEGYDTIIIGLYHTVMDDEENNVPPEELIRWTSANSPVPLFGFWDFAVGKGKAIGGLVLSARPQGRKAGELVRRILAGEKACEIEAITAETGRFLFSNHELKRWNLKKPVNLALPTITIRHIE